MKNAESGGRRRRSRSSTPTGLGWIPWPTCLQAEGRGDLCFGPEGMPLCFSGTRRSGDQKQPSGAFYFPFCRWLQKMTVYDTLEGREDKSVIFFLMETAKTIAMRLGQHFLHLPSVLPRRYKADPSLMLMVFSFGIISWNTALLWCNIGKILVTLNSRRRFANGSFSSGFFRPAG